MITIISEPKQVKIRKPHKCFACNRKFETGAIMNKGTYVYDSIYTLYTCQTCEKLLQDFKDYFWDDMEECFPEFVVLEGLQKDETPEQLYERLKTMK